MSPTTDPSRSQPEILSAGRGLAETLGQQRSAMGDEGEATSLIGPDGPSLESVAHPGQALGGKHPMGDGDAGTAPGVEEPGRSPSLAKASSIHTSRIGLTGRLIEQDVTAVQFIAQPENPPETALQLGFWVLGSNDRVVRALRLFRGLIIWAAVALAIVADSVVATIRLTGTDPSRALPLLVPLTSLGGLSLCRWVWRMIFRSRTRRKKQKESQ
jgi:hypothetical protein